MSLLTNFFPNKPWLFKKQINDSFFGLMWFNKKKKNDMSHYQCQIIFSQTNKLLDVFIDSEKKIDPFQKVMFFEFEKYYDEILESIKIPLAARIKKIKLIDCVNLEMKSDFYIWSLVIHSKESDHQYSIGLSSDKYNISNIRLAINNYKFKEFLN